MFGLRSPLDLFRDIAEQTKTKKDNKFVSRLRRLRNDLKFIVKQKPKASFTLITFGLVAGILLGMAIS